MTLQKPNQNKINLDMIEKVGLLFDNLEWDLEQGVYLENEQVSILIDPVPTDLPQQYHLPITILPLQNSAADLAGLPILLTSNQNATMQTCFGCLDRRGQIVFRHVPSGSYQANVPTVPAMAAIGQDVWGNNSDETLANWLSSLLSLTQSLFWDAEGAQYHFSNANSWLKVVLKKQEGEEAHLSIQVSDATWDGNLLGFVWRDVSDKAKGYQLLLAAVAWQDEVNACVADLNLGVLPEISEICLTERPFPLTALNEQMIPIVQQSIAATAQSPFVWQRLLEEQSEHLTATIYTAIEAALSAQLRQSSPWDLLESARGQIRRLSSQVRIRVEQGMAFFDDFPAVLVPEVSAIPVARSKSRNIEEPQKIQSLPISSPDLDISLSLKIGPAIENKANLTIEVSQTSTQEPVRRVRVTIFTSERQPLEGDLTREEGMVSFQNIEPGDYLVEVKYQGNVWQLPITFIPNDTNKEG